MKGQSFMKNIATQEHPEKNRLFWLDEGKIYFSRESERKFYFFLSLIIFLAGLFYKMGVLQ